MSVGRNRSEFAIDRGSWRLAGTESGEGTTAVVFVHGWTCDHTTLAPQIDALSSGHRCIAVDLRGHGRSGAPTDGPWGIGDLASDVVQAIESLGADRVVLVGHSMGGTVAYEVAARLEARVDGLALLHPMPLRHTPESQALFNAVAEQLLADGSHDPTRATIVDGAMFTDETQPDLRARLRELMLATGREVATWCWDGLARYDPSHPPMNDLDAIVVNGTRAANDDALVATLLPRAQITHLPTGSFVQLEDSATVNRLLTELIDSL